MPDDRLPASQAFYLPLRGQRRFCIYHPPSDAYAVGESILYVHPFGEEMNKARRTAALASRALARNGWSVLQLDLAGCGDSDGEFGGATWRRWIDDVAEGARWLEERSGGAPWLWGLRTGCLVAADAARAASRPFDLLFWQPVLSGKQFLLHILRMRLAGALLSPSDRTRNGTQALRAELAQGRPVQIAGYDLSPGLALGLEAAELAPTSGTARVGWLDVSATGDPALAPASQARVDAWRRAGHRVEARVVTGEPFWQTQEIAECRALIDATLAALAALRT
ncbi:MAG: hydrolase 2, exosortase A system-associated [Deltaproteobacteria bacterium]|jgi:exosortase A-associated hydrolase 2